MNWYLKVLKQYVDFAGRARRKEYWMFFLFNFVIGLILSFIPKVGQTLNGIYSLVVLLPSIAVLVRRMHDVGKSGWFGLIPIYNLILALTKGETGANQYGEDPKKEEQ